MRTIDISKHLLLGALLLCSVTMAGQASVPGNGGAAGAFLGWNAGANQVLEVRNDANQPIEWSTDATRRMLLQETTTYGIGSFPNQVKNGSLLLCPKVDGFYNNGANGPFSLLHLAADDYNAQQASYRPWMNVGITFTGNSDQAYIGQKYAGNDNTDFVIQWA